MKGFKIALNDQLKDLLPNYEVIISLPYHGKGGSPIMIHTRFQQLDRGILEKGQGLWVNLHFEEVEFGVLFLYAPNKISLRKNLWDQLNSNLSDGNWIVVGQGSDRHVAATFGCDMSTTMSDQNDRHVGKTAGKEKPPIGLRAVFVLRGWSLGFSGREKFTAYEKLK